MHTENRTRSLAKAISWRIVATIITLSAVWFYTGAIIVSLESTLAIAIISTIAYYFHERAWNRAAWGRKSSQ